MSLSDRCLAELRCTAAAVVAVPSLRARIVHDGRTVLAVERHDGPPATARHPWLPPCAFHRAVARAHALHRSGERLGLRGVPDDADPSVHWGVRPGDIARPGSIARVACDDTWIHVAAVACPIDRCMAAVVGDDGGPPGLGFHEDDALDVTLLHLRTPAGDVMASREALEALEIAVARTAVDLLLGQLTTGS